jgi:hypothetical protein
MKGLLHIISFEIHGLLTVWMSHSTYVSVRYGNERDRLSEGLLESGMEKAGDIYAQLESNGVSNIAPLG